MVASFAESVQYEVKPLLFQEEKRAGKFILDSSENMTKTLNIFHIAESPKKVVCPPAQVFLNRDFEFMLTAGGHLVEDDAQYGQLLELLRENGETRFTVRENIGATLTDRKEPFIATFSTNSTLEEFDSKFNEFDEHFGMLIPHWYVYGQIPTWGIYIAEYPMINIIGCANELTDSFRRVFKIEGNGYEQEMELLERELKLLKDPIGRRIFFKNYKIKNAHQQGV
jgi:hypothetical protein